MQIKAIHQFHPSCSSGDGVSNGMVFTRRLLREMGYESEIYCDHIPEDMSAQARPRREMSLQPDQLLLVHHSLGYENCAWLDEVTTPKALVYHNITPVHLLPEHGGLRRLSTLGREQLAQWAPGFLGGIGDSELNAAELREAGYDNVQCIPLLVDIDHVRAAPVDLAAVEPLRNYVNLLFVGRIVENKHQIKLVEVLHELTHFMDQPVRLILAGGTSSTDYYQKLEARIAELGLQENVILAGKVPAAVLTAMYSSADAFVCMSEHEGFGMPLIEAMLFDVPVVAQAGTSIQDTMGSGGLILNNDDPREAAALLHLLLREPGLRRRVIAGQRKNLLRFAPATLHVQLVDFLARIGVEGPAWPVPPSAAPAKDFWQVEGPFDSSYSLAIVNRELGRAFAKRGLDVGLRSMEGSGDFVPSPAFLSMNPDCAALARRAGTGLDAPDVSLRFCYPPHVHDMHGRVRAMHSYGWEESGFPAEYVAAFNRKLDMVSVLSVAVEKILRDNGVRIPIVVTGAGVDHILNVQPEAPDLGLRGFSFLHISSCFPRKGIDVLLAAYGKAFRLQDDVTLVVKTFPNPHNTVAEQLRVLQQDPAYPHVVLIDRDCGDAELVGLYQACDAFVAPSRGEGLGMPMAEAMLFNLPVITTGWGGQLDFCDARTAWLCDFQFAKTQTHLGAAHSVWADPDVSDLARLLREVQQLPPADVKVRTDAARRRIMRDYTWDAVAQKIENAVDLVGRQPLFRKEGKIAWLSSWHTRCGIAAYSAFLTDAIPADRLLVLANRTSERTAEDDANVIRCWNQNYDETLDDAYDTIIAQGMAAVVVQYNFGFFTLATFARFINRLTDAGIGVHCFFHATADLVRDGRRISLGDIVPALARADRLYVHGVNDLNRFKQFGLVENVVFFPQGVLPTPAPVQESERQAYGLSGKTVLAAYGFLLPHKGVQHLIKAFVPLVKADPSLHLLLVNALYPVAESMQEKNACEDLIAKFGLGSSVTLMTDFLSDEQCLAMLSLADLIVYPYQQTQESSSAAVRMALAAGRPVAVTPLSIFEDVVDVVHSLPGADPESITQGLRSLLSDPALLQKQMPKAQQWTASRQWPLLSVRLLNLIDGLANPLAEPSAKSDVR